MDKLIVIILTYNSELTIQKVIMSCKNVTNNILVVDDNSSDGTVNLAKSLGCKVIKHKFQNYSKQRNWAQNKAELKKDDWVLHIDSDEVISDELAKNIKLKLLSSDCDGYIFKRLTFFQGRKIRYGHMNPNWHLRLYRANKGYCEDREYDQHYICEGRVRKLKGSLLDYQDISTVNWIRNHKKWAKAEAKEVIRKNKTNQLKGSFKGDPRKVKRRKKEIYYSLPLLIRPFIFYIYSYFFKLGFLDGLFATKYHFLHAFWFRMMVDIEIVRNKY